MPFCNIKTQRKNPKIIKHKIKNTICTKHCFLYLIYQYFISNISLPNNSLRNNSFPIFHFQYFIFDNSLPIIHLTRGSPILKCITLLFIRVFLFSFPRSFYSVIYLFISVVLFTLFIIHHSVVLFSYLDLFTHLVSYHGSSLSTHQRPENFYH